MVVGKGSLVFNILGIVVRLEYKWVGSETLTWGNKWYQRLWWVLETQCNVWNDHLFFGVSLVFFCFIHRLRKTNNVLKLNVFLRMLPNCYLRLLQPFHAIKASLSLAFSLLKYLICCSVLESKSSFENSERPQAHNYNEPNVKLKIYNNRLSTTCIVVFVLGIPWICKRIIIDSLRCNLEEICE